VGSYVGVVVLGVVAPGLSAKMLSKGKLIEVEPTRKSRLREPGSSVEPAEIGSSDWLEWTPSRAERGAGLRGPQLSL